MLDVPSITIFGFNIVKFAVDLGNAYMLFLVVSLSLNLEAGYTGVPNFGKVMFMAGGAAISAAVCGQLAVFILGVNVHGNYNGYIVTVINQVNASLSKSPLLSVELVLLGTILAAGIGGLLGFLASYPAIRLREDYLGMLLLASAQFFQIFLGAYYPLIGGTQGISVPDFFGWAGNGIGVRDVAILGFLSLFATLLISILAFRPGGILPEKSSLTIQKNKLSMIIKSANVLELRTVSSSGEKFPADRTSRDSKTTD